MKALKEFSAYHPLLAIIIFDIVASALSLGVGYFIHLQAGWDLGTVVFLESMVFLLIAYYCISGNSKLKSTNFSSYREFKHDDSAQMAHLFSLKYGIVGVILFFSTWFLH